MRSKAFRIYQRKKKINIRKKQMDMFNWTKGRPIEGKLANHSALGCPDGKYCMVCHPGKYPRIKTIQEKKAESVKDQIDSLDE